MAERVGERDVELPGAERHGSARPAGPEEPVVHFRTVEGRDKGDAVGAWIHRDVRRVRPRLVRDGAPREVAIEPACAPLQQIVEVRSEVREVCAEHLRELREPVADVVPIQQADGELPLPPASLVQRVDFLLHAGVARRGRQEGECAESGPEPTGLLQLRRDFGVREGTRALALVAVRAIGQLQHEVHAVLRLAIPSEARRFDPGPLVDVEQVQAHLLEHHVVLGLDEPPALPIGHLASVLHVAMTRLAGPVQDPTDRSCPPRYRRVSYRSRMASVAGISEIVSV